MERDNVRMAMQGYAQTFDGIGSRGRGALLMDSELDAMIKSEANDDKTD
jgi:hypothetical protein